MGLYQVHTSGTVTPEEMHVPGGENFSIVTFGKKNYTIGTMQIYYSHLGKIYCRAYIWSSTYERWGTWT